MENDKKHFSKKFDTTKLDIISENIRLAETSLKGCPFTHKIGPLCWDSNTQRIMFDDDNTRITKPFIETKAIIRIENYHYIKQLFDEINRINEGI